MTEKNIFVYKLFLSLNISDFIFYVKTASPLKKLTHLLFPSSPLQKIEILSSPLLLKSWLEDQVITHPLHLSSSTSPSTAPSPAEMGEAYYKNIA